MGLSWKHFVICSLLWRLMRWGQDEDEDEDEDEDKDPLIQDHEKTSHTF